MYAPVRAGENSRSRQMFGRRKAAAIGVYGIAVLGSGLLSLLGSEPGKAGLWFGSVMGGLARIASLLLGIRLRHVGMAVAWLAVGFVGGWFLYDVFFQRGLARGTSGNTPFSY